MSTSRTAASGTVVLLLGRTAIDVDTLRAQLGLPDVLLRAGTSLADAQSAFTEQPRIDHVIMGAGIDLDVRLRIVQHVFTVSQVTTVHLKDTASGPTGFPDFVAGILTGLRNGAAGT